MGYFAQARGGQIITESVNEMETVINRLTQIGIDAEDDRDVCHCEINIFGGFVNRYEGSAFEPIAKIAKEDSFIRFLGEDDAVWTLKFIDGMVVDYPGEILWEQTAKEVLDSRRKANDKK